jgi:hypothetical protein
MKVKILSVLALGIILFCPACNSGINNMEIGKIISPEDYRRLKENEKNDDRRFAIVGYPYLCEDLGIGGKKEASLFIYTEPNGRGEMIVWLPIKRGKGKNEFYVPDDFSFANIQLFDNDGQELNFHDKAIFSFTIDLKTEDGRSENFYFKKKEGSNELMKAKIMGYFYTLKDVRIDKG